jgi:hypothetical protein
MEYGASDGRPGSPYTSPDSQIERREGPAAGWTVVLPRPTIPGVRGCPCSKSRRRSHSASSSHISGKQPTSCGTACRLLGRARGSRTLGTALVNAMRGIEAASEKHQYGVFGDADLGRTGDAAIGRPGLRQRSTHGALSAGPAIRARPSSSSGQRADIDAIVRVIRF